MAISLKRQSRKPNSWLAFSSDESKVVGRGDTYSEAIEDAESMAKRTRS
jgi:hypothetical protein